MVGVLPCLGQRAVVPDVSVVREAVGDVAEFPLLDVLLDGVQVFLGGDLHLGVGPARHLDHHVEDLVALVGEERDVVERRNGAIFILDVDAVIQRVGASLLQNAVRHASGGCWNVGGRPEPLRGTNIA